MTANAAPRTVRPLWNPQVQAMTLLLLEALGAFLLFIFIVWWTMFSGRKNGELPDDLKQDDRPTATKEEPAHPDR